MRCSRRRSASCGPAAAEPRAQGVGAGPVLTRQQHSNTSQYWVGGRCRRRGGASSADVRGTGIAGVRVLTGLLMR